MAKGRKTGGRQKGTSNHSTVVAKEAFQLAFEKIGGVDALAGWGTKHPTEFYRLYSRLIPLTGDAPLESWADLLREAEERERRMMQEHYDRQKAKTPTTAN